MSEKRLSIALFALLCCALAYAQAPSSLNVEGKEYPKVNPDRSVTFQFRAPSANAVSVSVGKDYPMEIEWTTSDASINNGSFTMPTHSVSFVGTFTPQAETKYTEKKAKEMIGSVVTTYIYEIMKNGKDFDVVKYARDLKRLK